LVRHETEMNTPTPAIEALRLMRLLLLEEGHCFRDQALSFCDFRTTAPREGLDGSSLSTLVQMVGAGIGVTLIPEMAIGVETRAAPVCVGHFQEPEPSRTVGMVWRNTNPLAAQFTELAELVKRCATKA
jgi:LysR family hydrogen peroxide-inducible transcriptional activator